MSKKQPSTHKSSLTGQYWYQLSVDEVLKKMKTTKEGLSVEAVASQKKKYGLNKLPEKKPLSVFTILLNQFKSAFIYILLIAAGISYALEEHIDATVILAAVFINVVVGLFQEYKAQRALEALQKVVTSKARVRRSGKIQIIDASEVVPGDIVLLQPGDKVPADIRLLSVKNLEAAEASLTGESTPVKKKIEKLEADLVLGDQENMVFMGTIVTQGTGSGVVVATAEQTEIGKIANLVSETKEEPTPLQVRLDRFGRKLALLVLGISLVIFAVGTYSDYSFGEMFTTSVAVAVAAIPEGLTVAVTVILAVGMRRILKEQGLVKKLLAAETLGSTSVICTDKTGTLTRGEMRLAQIVGESEVTKISSIESAEPTAEYGLSLMIGVLCNNAVFLNKNSKNEEVTASGSPTEKALLLAGWQAGLDKDELEKKFPKLDEVPFDSEKKYMMTLHSFSKEENIIYLKGASEKTLSFCDQVYRSSDGKNHEKISLDARLKGKQVKQYEKMSSEGLRVLAVAYKKVPAHLKTFEKIADFDNEHNSEKKFVFVGFMGLQDPLRPDTRETIKVSQDAGVRTIMITGDHKLTAQSIAKDLGLPHGDKNILTGSELAALSESELKKIVSRISVYARVTPEDKLKIVKAWQDLGATVAMTGDGVNDAPALKKADIGVAVGSGTEVSKETADLILLDDDFKTIVSAIKQGRVIYDNVKKVILYFLSDSFTEMIIIVFGLLAGWPMPLLASQILWINIVNDTFPALAMTQEPEEPEVMKEQPARRRAAVLDFERKMLIGIISASKAIGTLIIFWYYFGLLNVGEDYARTVAFAVMGICSLLYIFPLKSLRRPIWNINLLSNKYLVVAVMVGIILQLCAIYLPFFQKILHTQALQIRDWLFIVVVSLVISMVVELIKFLFTKVHARKAGLAVDV